jgi:hypothetical protein
MARFTIWRIHFDPPKPGMLPEQHAIILGTYEGKDENAALEALAKDEGDASFAAACKRRKNTRDHYKLEKVE